MYIFSALVNFAKFKALQDVDTYFDTPIEEKVFRFWWYAKPRSVVFSLQNKNIYETHSNIRMPFFVLRILFCAFDYNWL